MLKRVKTLRERLAGEDSIIIEKPTSPIQDIKNTFQLLINPRMIMLLPWIIWSSINICVYSSVFLQFIIRTMENSADINEELANNHGKQMGTALLTMMLFGLG